MYNYVYQELFVWPMHTYTMHAQLLPLCRFEKKIGNGQFGTVYKAQWTFPIREGEGPSPQIISAHVAIKVMGEATSQEDRIKFLQEVVLLAQFNDPNIVAVFGVITESTEVSSYTGWVAIASKFKAI